MFGRWRPDCMADDAVSCELVSAANSLLTGKLTGNFAELANSKACSQIPYATEQGIFVAITGNFFAITGNLIERAAKALSCCRSRISTALDVNSALLRHSKIDGLPAFGGR